ncbi:MAG: tRNA (adenosine(37)-N6)-threonylcarbamoyltransferase complex ATPase subunit type 1 TsaE [Nitrospirales bacterium]
MSDTQPSRLALRQSGNSWIATLSSAQATESLGYKFGRQCSGGEVITLMGDLGTGKTVLARGLALGLDIDPQLVMSPTFTLIQEYCGRVRFIHADLYRLENPNELASLGIHEYFSPSTVVAIEWAERMGNELPADRLNIQLDHQQPTVRKATLTTTGPRSLDLINKIYEQTTT